MEIQFEGPSRIRLLGVSPEEVSQLQKELAYLDQRVDFELSKTKKSLRAFKSGLKSRLQDSWGHEKYDRVVAEMEAKVATLTMERKKTLLFEQDGVFWTYSGVAKRLCSKFDAHHPTLPVSETGALPWANPPKFQDRPYQEEALAALVEHADHGPCGIELPTGSGKSVIVRNALKYYGLSALVMAPSVSIATQLYDDLVEAFGKKYVGLFGDGKKQSDKKIVVGIDDSLAKVQPSSQHWENLSSKQLFFADESHLTPATSLQKVCFGLMKDAKLRFFCSATQLRNDGLALVLEGITGPIVYRKTARELIEAGWLAKPVCKMVRVKSHSKLQSSDPNRMTRAHLYYNPIVNKAAADLANNFVTLMRRPVIILVEELEQFAELLTHLKHKTAFAHGPLDKERKLMVPEEYHSPGNKKLVEAFNAGEIPILVGTSCIATGTDIRVAEAGIYLMGGRSEIKVKQALGRETRGGFNGKVFNPWTGAQKLDCIHVDFEVVEAVTLPGSDPWAPGRHAAARAEIYAEVYAPPETIDYTHLQKESL